MSMPDWAWLLLAFRQDRLIWSHLQNSLAGSSVIEKAKISADDCSIAAWILQNKMGPEDLRKLSKKPMESLLPEMHLELENARQEWSENPTSSGSLEQCMFVALSLREDYLKTGGWDPVIDEIIQHPGKGKTILACLLGIISNPAELLADLLTKDSNLLDLKLELAVHAQLCQPLSPADQRNEFKSLLDRLPVSLGVRVLNVLTKQRPWLVKDLSDALLSRTDEKTRLLISDRLTAKLFDLAKLVELATLNRQAAQPARSISQLIEALKQAKHIQGYLSAQLAQVVMAAKQEGKAEKQETDLEAWKQAVRLAPDEPDYYSGLVRSMVQEGRLADAQLQLGEWLSKDRYPEHAELLMVSSQVASGLGDKEKAFTLAKQALELLENGSTLEVPGYLTLSDIFGQNNRMDLTDRVLTAGLENFSTDLDLLSSSAQVGLSLNKPGRCIDQILAYHAVATVSSTENQTVQIPLSLRYLQVKGLEGLQEWGIALSERLELLALNANPENKELYDTAGCAINADQPQKALELCQPLLDKKADDDMALGLVGEAHCTSGDYITGIDHLRKAVSIAPARAELWLNLARACKLAGMEAQKLDVLKTASQALPEDASIHLALGEAYLLRNAPTQALIYLRQAASLNDQPQISLRLGQTLHQLGHLQEARDILEKTYLRLKKVRLASDDQQEPDLLELEAMQAYARSLITSGDHEIAKPLLEKVVEQQPEIPTPYMDLGRALLNGQPTTQQAQQAIAYLQKAISLIAESSPELVTRMSLGDAANLEAEALSLLAEAYAVSGELQQSQAVYRQVLDDQVAQKSGWRARLAIGFSRVAIKLEQPETALTVLKEALQKEPENILLLQSLADAYLANGLSQDAYDMASKVIGQQPVELETIQWFINIGNQLRKHPGGIQTLVQRDMIRLLQNATRYEPTRADLLIQLGKLLLEKGERQPAISVFRKLADLGDNDWHTDAFDLYQAGKMMREWGEASLSVYLLEKAIEKTDHNPVRESAQSAVQLADIYKELSISHQKNNNPPEALKAVDQAIRFRPDQTEFYLHKADIYSDLRKPQEMLDSLKPALKLSPENPAVNHRVAQALYINGDLPGALKHAEQALLKKENGLNVDTDLKTRFLAAEVSYAMLRPRQALAYLPEALPDFGDDSLKFEQASLQAELALEVGDRNLAETAVAEMRKINPDDPRGLAVQARLASLKGDQETARRLLQTANQILERQLSQPSERNGRPVKDFKADRERSICRSAIWLRQWELAYFWSCKGVECAPHEPLSHLLKAKVIAERAEEQALCDDLAVIVHAPGEEALAETALAEFEQSIQEAEQTTRQFAEFPGDESSQAINLWKARGFSAFHPNYSNAEDLEEAVLSFPPTAEDVAALIMAYRRTGEPAKAIKVSKDEFIEVYSGNEVYEHPLVLVQLSLAHAGIDQQKALDLAALSSLKAELNKADQGAKRWPEIPMTYYLQAILAHQAGLLATALQAIQKALADWPEEPRWHALAAQIYQGSDVQKDLPNLQKARTHLELATRLEPLYALHFIQLGRLYFGWGDTEKAVVALEQAGKLAPDNAEIWMLLAEVHQAAGDLDQAALIAERAMEKLPDKSQALILSGNIALKAKNPRVALSRAQSVLNKKPENAQALHLMAHSLEALHRPDEALSLLEKAIPKIKDPVQTQMERLLLLYRAKGLESGLEALQDIVDQNGNTPELLALLAQWLSEADQIEAAVQTARIALQADNDRLTNEQKSEMYRLIGLNMKQTGQLDQAIHALSQAVQFEPDKMDNYLNLANAYLDRREHTQALKILKQAMVQFPEDYRPYLQSGIVYKENKEYVEAEKMLRSATKLAPGEVSIHRLLGAVVALNLVHNR